MRWLKKLQQLTHRKLIRVYYTHSCRKKQEEIYGGHGVLTGSKVINIA